MADGVTGDVLAEQGPPDPDRGAAVRWGALLPGVLRSAGDVEDVMITAERTYHLLRRVRDGPRVLLVHVSVDRERGTLAVARRTLGNLDLHRPIDTAAPPSAAVSMKPRVPPALPVRTPRSPLSAVPPPRAPAPGERAATRPAAVGAAVPAAAPDTAATASGPASGPAPDIPEARGWSDDLYTMRRLLDGLRKLS